MDDPLLKSPIQISTELTFASIVNRRSRLGRACKPLRLRDGLATSQFFNQAAGDVADGDVTFLDALRVIRRDVQQKIDFAGELPTRVSRKRYEIGPAGAPGFHSANDIGAIAARRERHKNVVFCYERFNLPGKDSFESVIVACRGQYRRVCSKRQSRQARALRSESYHQFSGEMLSVRSAAAIPKKNDLAPRPQSGRGFLRELRDSADQFIGKTDRKSTRLNSSHGYISYAVFCLKKKKTSDATRAAQR